MDKEKTNMMSEKKYASIWQFIKFGLVGVMNTVISYVTYSLTYYWILGASGLSEDIRVQIANILGFVISVLNAYIWQSRFVFKESEEGEHRVWWKVLIKTYISYAFSGLILTSLLLIFWMKIVQLHQYLGWAVQILANLGIHITPEDAAASVAPFLNMVVTIPINFCVNKFWAYKQKRKER